MILELGFDYKLLSDFKLVISLVINFYHIIDLLPNLSDLPFLRLHKYLNLQLVLPQLTHNIPNRLILHLDLFIFLQ